VNRVVLVLVVGCGSKAEPPAVDLTCPAVVEHVAKLTLRPIDYARPVTEPKAPISETDPRAFRQRRVDQAIDKACGKQPVDAYGPCARKVVLDAMAQECLDREWSEERRRCLLAAGDAAALDACGPAPAPILDVPATADARPTNPIGADCFGDADCGASAKCVTWTTEGGERHATCEIPCGPKPDYACPSGRGCVHQGGGPSEVCLEQK
jgi:hypothetical protein